MRTVLLAIVLVASAPGFVGDSGAAAAQHARRVALTLSATIEEPGGPARVWFPMPRNSRWQTLERFSVAGDYRHTTLTDSIYGNRFLVVDVPARSGGDAAVEVSYVVTRRPVPKYQGDMGAASSLTPSETGHAEDVAAPTARPQDASLAIYLLPRRLVPLDGPIALEAKQVAGDIEDPMEKARRLFDHLVRTMRYDKSGEGWGRGDALYACTERAGNCTDFHSLFIAEARTLGLPARFIMGLPLPEKRGEGEISGYHCWAEFHIEGKGWLPVDASEASKHMERKDSYFSALDANRVAFTLGRDVVVPGTNHEPFNYFIYPYVEIEGKSYEGIETRFFFEDLP